MSDFLQQLPASENIGPKIGLEDRSIPFLRILQSLSPACQEGDDQVKGAKPGIFINSVTNALYGNKIQVIPVWQDKTWLEFKPKRGGFVGRHLPDSMDVDKSDFSEWRTAEGNIIVESYNFFLIIKDRPQDGILVLALKSSDIKHAKNWNTFIDAVRLPNGEQAQFFSSVWELETKLNKNGDGTWYTLGVNNTSITRIGFISELEYKSYVKPILTNLTSVMSRVDYAQNGQKSVEGLPGA